MKQYNWAIKPVNTPAVVRYCAKCGSQSDFVSSGNFRVNAQQHNLDVWLIYKCAHCDTTWNMEVFSRINSKKLDQEQYKGFLANDAILAERYAFDMQTLNRNHAVIKYDTVEYLLEGDTVFLPPCEGTAVLKIVAQYPMQLRLDKLLSGALGVSRQQIKRLMEQRAIADELGGDASKCKLKQELTLHIKPAEIQKLRENQLERQD